MTTDEYLDTLTPAPSAYVFDNIVDNNSPSTPTEDDVVEYIMSLLRE